MDKWSIVENDKKSLKHVLWPVLTTICKCHILSASSLIFYVASAALRGYVLVLIRW
jgi:hypothetical protein